MTDAERKAALLEKLDQAKVKANEEGSPQSELLIDDAIELAVAIPPEEDPGTEPPKP